MSGHTSFPSPDSSSCPLSPYTLSSIPIGVRLGVKEGGNGRAGKVIQKVDNPRKAKEITN